MSKLLLDEQPLLIMPELATRIGLNESIVLQQIHYWLEINKKAGVNFKDGRYWTFSSYGNWQIQFPFWSIKTISRTITSLRQNGLILCANYNKLKMDKTTWYSIDYKKLDEAQKLPCGQNDLIE